MESINFPKPQFVCSASQTPSGNCHSAIIFSGPRLRQLENFQRFPATYIGVRRVRPSGGAKLKICDKSLCSSLKNREGDTFVPNDLGADKSKHAFDGNDVIATDITTRGVRKIHALLAYTVVTHQKELNTMKLFTKSLMQTE